MFSKINIVAGVCVLSSFTSLAQEANKTTIEGSVFDMATSEPIAEARILDHKQQLLITSDTQGNFSIAIDTSIIPYLLIAKEKYSVDTFFYKTQEAPAFIFLQSKSTLDGVTVTSRVNATEVSTLGFQKVERISSRELMKAACCNLSESFETTPSVDVGFTDAVSGYKQIQMLGLTGSHTLFTRENIPDVRGLAATTGLTFTPGTFVESMQLSKGTGSVVNGFEGTAGQINVEWLKPFEAQTPTWLFNGYQSVQGRSEANVVYNKEINHDLSTNVFVHAKSNWMNLDQNNDNFIDQPKGEAFVLGNRWFYFTHSGFEIQAGVKGVFMKNRGGETGYFTSESPHQYWSYQQDINRMEGWAKIGKVNPNKKWQSMGLQLSGVYHDQSSQYGSLKYDGKQSSFYGNYIYQSIIENTNHVIKGGASINYDKYNETFKATPFNRTEVVTGAFAEYSYNHFNKFNVVAGLRADYHNIYGFFATPRLHLRYAPTERSAIRGSIGRAQRTANIFAENFAHMASNRDFFIESSNPKGVYGLNPEIAWNMGLNYTQKFRLNYRDGSIGLDYYYTDFTDQVVVDIENPRAVTFYQLDGKSFAHSLQVQVDYELVKRLDVRLAYRWYDVKTTYQGQLLEKPLVGKHRAFMNVGYATKNDWKFDATFQVMGAKRLPAHSVDGTNVLVSSYTKAFTTLNAQISKSWNNETFEVYLGMENIVGNMQHHMILNSNNTNSPYFDASLVWGQGMGRNIYIGFRYKIPKKASAPAHSDH